MANQSWIHATLALRLLRIDAGLGGVCIRARSGPVRDRLTAMIDPTARRLHPAISDEALFGGLDLSATLASGHLVQENGLLETAGPLILAMAERTTIGLAARLAVTLDKGHDHTLIALDEGAEYDECLNPKLAERLAFHIDLSDCRLDGTTEIWSQTESTIALADVTVPRGVTEQITRIAGELGIDSMRAALFAIRAARAHAVLNDRKRVTSDDLEVACALTLAHRATRVPEPQTAEEPPAPPPEQIENNRSEESLDLPDELLLEAVRALLPDNLLNQLTAQKARAGRGNGTGAARKGNRRGRPLPSRAGRISDGARIDIIGTLRAAAPWQTIRRNATGREGLQIRPADIRIKRFEEKSDRLLIFTVDASGSSALTRLAEAKGAVELLLAQAYARRDHVALVAFRGTEAEVLLPPTRSLVQTKRRLAGLPGGGGTPLAAGMMTAFEQATQATRRGLTPTIAILTDGRANIALDGKADRKQAATDAQQIARVLRAHGTDTIVIDTGNRPEPALRNLAQTLDAAYLPLPRADAERLSKSVVTALGD
ncbi:protoporphyrin IX magnesium-chelatase [Yoonia maricola]|uniref:Protoporphyrin IX magnesium-chelatase n=1 Tax=Yoonia maricola TaxID=420999 RepID=A0A2M8W4Q9_9RHOB|nr:magnesium chelatase subunit D [Yoonia maricola]PJI85912.1 protoporphyrin IX magnesium-chelatase [Yoonia maricola]